RALQTGLVPGAADISDLPQRRKIFIVDLELVIGVRQLEIGGARLRDHVELSPPRFLKCRERLGCRNPAAYKVFPRDGDQLLDAERLIHEGIRRYVDKTAHA